MAYVNLVNQACADKNEFFCRMRDFICKRNGTYDYSTTGIGWTLHDESYATDEDNVAINDWYVIYSAGEGGEEDLYYKVSWISAHIKIEGYQSWDNSTNAGSTNKYNSGNNFSLTEADAKTLWVYGDMSFVSVLNKLTSTDYRLVMFGKSNVVWDTQTTNIASCSSALTAGSDVSITVDAAPSNWEVGTDLFIRTTHNDAMSTVKIEKARIKTIVGNVITMDLDNSYTADSNLSDFLGYIVSNSISAGSFYSLYGDNDGLAPTLSSATLNIPKTYFDPSFYEDKFVLISLICSGIGGILSLPYINEVPSFNAFLTYEDIIEEADGTEWRCFKCYNAKYWAFKEV